MSKASYASLILARFDEVRLGGPINELDGVVSMFQSVGADVRAAATAFDSETAFKFAIFGLHDSVESARACVANRSDSMPWIAEASEVWCGVLAPFRHFGESNFLAPDEPGALFETMQPEPLAGTPIVVATTAGWTPNPEYDMNAIRDFGAGVSAVRISMSGTPGLHSQQTFSFPGGLEIDGLTVTFWKDFASMRDFAYGSGLHRNQVKRQRADEFGARTSFTRFAVVESEGTWHGTDPLIW